MAKRVGRLEVDEVGDRQQGRVELVAGQPDAQRRLGRDHRVPGLGRVEPVEDHPGIVHRTPRPGRGRTVTRTACPSDARWPPPSPPTRWATSMYSRDLRRAATRWGWLSPFNLPGQPSPSHCSYEAPTASLDLVGQPELFGQRRLPTRRAARSSRRGSGDPTWRTPGRPGSGAAAGCPHRRAGCWPTAAARLPDLVVVLAGLEGDVIAEPLGLLVGVGMASRR